MEPHKSTILHKGFDFPPSTWTQYLRDSKQDSNQAWAVPRILKQSESLDTRVAWSTVSKAADRSKSRRNTDFLIVKGTMYVILHPNKGSFSGMIELISCLKPFIKLMRCNVVHKLHSHHFLIFLRNYFQVRDRSKVRKLLVVSIRFFENGSKFSNFKCLRHLYRGEWHVNNSS